MAAKLFRPIALLTALRFMSGRRSSRMVSFISSSSTVGIAVGITAIILVLSVMNGFERALSERLLAVIPHAEVVSLTEPMTNWQGFSAQLEARDDIEAVAPFININGMVSHGEQMRAVQVKGIDPSLQSKVSAYADYLYPNVSQSLTGREIILGGGIADALNVEAGDTINVLVPNESQPNRLSAPKSYPFEVVSIFRFGGQIDGLTAYIHIDEARVLANLDFGVKGLELKVQDIFTANKAAYSAGASLPMYVYVSDWMRANGHVYHDIQMVRGIVYLVMVLVIGVACFNIVSSLVMAVQDKRSEIAILLTMGASGRMIMSTFVWQGVLTGVIGVAFGAAGGALLSVYLGDILHGVESVIGQTMLSGDIYFIDQIPSELHLQDVLTVSVVAWVTAFTSTLYPAWRASRILPANELGGH
ncbi:lipoprotein-releasing ABC transporter permease subunit LolE [Echinimonas agarilytica]|uniref:Lipoprotein-releasing ABC transporter permease subunit LolE n=1 Tax=Echinimonas agarilytica TaxID=1215918 RepID=A0AA41W6Q4_9GAMM|nr:lipoprotein-releasing ABC transporter permease subunit LolE [Echinimonas agarilytica]MCM2679940.1 lipoprotein-releasing ABC transporter permease subunit LolE [Echinimonas agarilytica]